MKKNIKLLIVLFLAAYFYIGYTSIINRHTHFYPNGIVITHSHPVDKSNTDKKPFSHHNHSSTQICFFQGPSFDKFILPSAISVTYTPFEISSDYRPFIEAPAITTKIKKIPPRAPPA